MKKEQKNSPQKPPKKRSEKILSVVTSLLLIFSVLFCFSVVYQMQTKRFVSIFGCSVFRVVTDSMEPAIPVGALIVSKETEIEKINVKDIICFRSRESYMYGQIVTHRVIGIETVQGEIALRTRGDSNNSEDGFYVTQSNLVGKVIFHTEEKSFITNLYALLTSGTGFFTLIVVPVLLVAVFIMHESISKITKEMKKLKEELEKEQAVEEERRTSDSPEHTLEIDQIHHFEGENRD